MYRTFTRNKSKDGLNMIQNQVQSTKLISQKKRNLEDSTKLIYGENLSTTNLLPKIENSRRKKHRSQMKDWH